MLTVSKRWNKSDTWQIKSFVKNVKLLKESLQGSGKCSNFAADLARGGSKSDGTKPVRLAGKPVKCNKKQMYAIVEINGQQFKVEEGKKIFVNHIREAEEGQTVEFDKVLLIDNEGAITVGTPTVEGAKVVCEVINPLVKGEKVIVFKMKRRKDYRKKNGHRQQYTQVEIKSVIA